jgi:DNA-binding transcriptional LysR family regulator
MDDVDANGLVALDALLATRSVTLAAKTLGITQSAMSHRLQKLRRQLGDPLLAGGRAGLVLTPRAHAMVAPLRRALADLRAAVRSTDAFDASVSMRKFTIAANDYGELVALRPLLQRLAKQAPRIAIAIEPISGNIEERLASGSIDAAVTASGATAPSLRRKVIARDTYVVALRKGHPALRKHRRLSLETYVSLSHLQVAPYGFPGSVVDQILAARGKARRIAVRVSSFVSAPLLVAASDLIATLGSHLLRAASDYVDLVTLPPPIALPSTDIVMMWHERSHVDPGHTWLRQLITTSMAHQIT